MKSIFALLGVCLALGYGGIGCGEAANATSDVEPVLKAGEEECEMCRTPGSRASFLKAALAEEKRVANVEPLTAEEVTAALAEEIIGQDLALEEVPVFNETRVPDMPRVRTAEEWQAKASDIRKQVLDRVVFRGGAADWRDTPLRVKWGKTIEDLPGYRIKKLKFEAVPGWWIPVSYTHLTLPTKA